MTLQSASIQKKRSSKSNDAYALLLDQIAKVEASLSRMRQQMLAALEQEMETLTSLRCELLEAKIEEATRLEDQRNQLHVPEFQNSSQMLTETSLNILKFSASQFSEIRPGKHMDEASLHPVLERASVQDLSDALAAAFQQSPEKV
jgi:hypothetical protein